VLARASCTFVLKRCLLTRKERNRFSNSTVANNSGAGLTNVVYTINISGSIVTDGCASAGGTYIDKGYNLGCFSGLPTNLQLGPLANNGGPTQTLALLKGSSAIDAIPLSSGLCPARDQRGHKRPDNPQESSCDIGAFES
jgi:hypothetical protein